MTERKRLHEQVAFPAYQQESQHTLRRVVTIPQADPASAWNTFAQRQERLRRERARPRTYVKMISRTFAQTGVRATNGRIKAVRRLPQHHSSPVPPRSGHLGRTVKRGFLWRLLGLFAVVGVVAIGVSFALTSNAFRIAQVNVVGTHNTTLIEAIQGMGMQGQNIFLIDVRGLADRIEANPLVKSVSLSRQLPNQLTVNVVERQPVLLWQTAQGSYSVDPQGVVIAPASETTGADHLPTVVDVYTLGKGQKGQQVFHAGLRLNEADIAFALEIFKLMPATTGITSFRLRYEHSNTGAGAYTIMGPEGWLAYLGGADDSNPLQNRLLELQAILAFAQQQHLALATIDLRYGLHPVYTVKS
jgi:hypothetical protein